MKLWAQQNSNSELHIHESPSINMRTLCWIETKRLFSHKKSNLCYCWESDHRGATDIHREWDLPIAMAYDCMISQTDTSYIWNFSLDVHKMCSNESKYENVIDIVLDFFNVSHTHADWVHKFFFFCSRLWYTNSHTHMQTMNCDTMLGNWFSDINYQLSGYAFRCAIG